MVAKISMNVAVVSSGTGSGTPLRIKGWKIVRLRYG